MIKFIAADLDGTLLNSKKQLPDNFFNTVKRLNELGIIFAAASGRQYYNVEQLFEPVRDEMMFIAENGGIAFEKGRMIYSECMDDNSVLRMTEEITKIRPDIKILLSGEKSAYVKSDDMKFYDYSSEFCVRLDAIDSFADFIKKGDHIIKIAVYDENAEYDTYPKMSECEPDFNVILSNKQWVDIVAKHVNKGTAVKNLMKRFNIAFDEAMVFGDYLNDFEMMSSCKYSYAMANGHEKLKAAANFIAPSNDDNGVMSEIYKQVPKLCTERIN